MAVLRICKYPEESLQTTSKNIKAWSDDLTSLVGDMLETMYGVNGIGLAANQVGLPIKMAVIDAKPSGKSKRIVLINPKIIEEKGHITESEGCLSLPGIFCQVKRSEMIRILSYDENGVPFEIKAKGLLARALQHEIDHLEGKLIIDRLGPWDKIKVKREIKEYQKIWAPCA
ncbi:peptide deformylase [Elusimicrobiota bacterium]